MGKYAPLTGFLRKQPLDEVPMTFAQIERVIEVKLPPKARRHHAWWSNSPSDSVITKAWLDAGFRSEQVDIKGRKLVFRRVSPKARTPGEADSEVSARHPLIGWMKDTVRIALGVDLTEPADPDWGKRAWGD
jgi:hypothetical protein